MAQICTCNDGVAWIRHTEPLGEVSILANRSLYANLKVQNYSIYHYLIIAKFGDSPNRGNLLYFLDCFVRQVALAMTANYKFELD